MQLFDCNTHRFHWTINSEPNYPKLVGGVKLVGGEEEWEAQEWRSDTMVWGGHECEGSGTLVVEHCCHSSVISSVIA